MVIVNLYHDPLGHAMTYRGLKDFFDRLARNCGFKVRPHMMRHTAATNWTGGVRGDPRRLASTTAEPFVGRPDGRQPGQDTPSLPSLHR
jgi:integrase